MVECNILQKKLLSPQCYYQPFIHLCWQQPTEERDTAPGSCRITSLGQWGQGARTVSTCPPYRCQIHTTCRGTSCTSPWTSPHPCFAWSSLTAHPSCAPSTRNPWSRLSASALWAAVSAPSFRERLQKIKLRQTAATAHKAKAILCKKTPEHTEFES